MFLTLTSASKRNTSEGSGSLLFSLLDEPVEMALERVRIEDLSVVSGADRMFQCLDSRFLDREEHDKVGESLDDELHLLIRVSEQLRE